MTADGCGTAACHGALFRVGRVGFVVLWGFVGRVVLVVWGVAVVCHVVSCLVVDKSH